MDTYQLRGGTLWRAWKVDLQSKLLQLENPKVILLIDVPLIFAPPLRASVRTLRQNILSSTDVVPHIVFLIREFLP